MAKRKNTVLILVILIVLVSFFGIPSEISALPPPPDEDSFIADIFPSINNTHIELLNVNALITINASDFYNRIELSFNGNYTIFNPGNTTDLTIYLPFSLCLDFENALFGASVNDTQVPYEIENTTVEELTNSGFKIEFIWYLFYLPCPVRLIMFNLTLQENNTYVVNHQFDGCIYDPLGNKDVIFMMYSSGSAKFWKGNASARVEFKIFGKIPSFPSRGIANQLCTYQLLDIDRGKRFITECNNSQSNPIAIGICYDEREYDIIPDGFLLNFLITLHFYTIPIGIIAWIIIRRKKRKF